MNVSWLLEIHLCGSDDRCAGDRGEGQVCQESTNHKEISGPADYSRAEASRRSNSRVSPHTHGPSGYTNLYTLLPLTSIQWGRTFDLKRQNWFSMVDTDVVDMHQSPGCFFIDLVLICDLGDPVLKEPRLSGAEQCFRLYFYWKHFLRDSGAQLFQMCVFSDQVISYSLCRRLPTDHVSGQLLFRVDITSTGQEGMCISFSPQLQTGI